MKNLYDLYCKDIYVKDVKTNSKKVSYGDVFVCINGVNKDRHLYIDEAINNGASFLVVSRGNNYFIPFIKVKNTNKELTNVCNYIYPYSKRIKLIGVTGTDGKTTVSSIIRDLLGNDNCGYIGTNGIKGKFLNLSVDNTTPALEVTYKALNDFFFENINYCSMEISSEGVLHNRIDGLLFDVGIFTNFTQDHLNVHGSIKNYLRCKRKLFNKIKKDGVAILNKDDSYFSFFKRSCKCKVFTYGVSKYSNLRILDYSLSSSGSVITYLYKGNKYVINSPLLGSFNVYNLSAAIGALLYYGYSFSMIRKKLFNIKVPFGRCEFLNFNTCYDIFLDYAHTANGVFNVLSFLNEIKKKRIITVIGSAGGREKEKRKYMGEYAQKLSDIVIYTMDDPRYEDVLSIIDDLIYKDMNNYIIEVDRKKAIFKALDMANDDDIVAILGKGRDNYMAIEDKKILYSDVLVLDDYFSKRQN